MAFVFILLLLAAGTLLIIGFISPAAALFWKKSGATRTWSAVFYSAAIIICFIGVAVSIPAGALKEAKEERRKAEQADAKETTPSGRVMSDEERRVRELVRSCDTLYSINSSYPFDNDTAYAYSSSRIMGPSVQYDSAFHLLPMERWMITTRRQTGPDVYDNDDKRRLTIYKPLHILSDLPDFKRMLEHKIIPVSPLGSSETFLVPIEDLTLKDPNRCGLLQKIKNGFFTLGTYVPTSDPDKRPTSQNEGGKWVDIPSGSIIVVLEYYDQSHKYVGHVYDAKGELQNSDYIDFDESTLVEKK